MNTVKQKNGLETFHSLCYNKYIKVARMSNQIKLKGGNFYERNG